ncbi:ABC transporter permease [Caballeronia mineralivorans]|jgi:putative spermidine/putrescine transport system permease protein|uniref:ABC transporter permease n=1 Tax=Caballeronia mineralivorans TaxID=2010198 RepID=UPI0023EFC678|nr:ABC transporter permease subunit [Caballeronia mineralivorans]MDB5780377.1 transporter permease [Caballeronia mineralivorans]MEA3100857.1 putative spermidine/putrescine transport system permease protein [Caballeronia mineralivorans]
MPENPIPAQALISEPDRQAISEPLASSLERRSFGLVIGMLGMVAAILLLAPTVIVVITSFTSGYSLKFPPAGYSARWYEALWSDSPELVDAFLLSAELAALATALSVVLSVAAALALARRKEGWARGLEALFLSPLMLPTLAIGLSLLMLFNLAEAGLSFTTLVIGHVAIISPYIVRTTSASLLQMNASLLESAHSLGASAVYVFRTVTLPLISRGILAGAFIGFMASFDNVAVSLFLSDARSQVLPIRMWQMIESNLDVRAAAVSGVLITVTLIMMIVMERVAGISKHLR